MKKIILTIALVLAIPLFALNLGNDEYGVKVKVENDETFEVKVSMPNYRCPVQKNSSHNKYGTSVSLELNKAVPSNQKIKVYLVAYSKNGIAGYTTTNIKEHKKYGNAEFAFDEDFGFVRPRIIKAVLMEL